MLWETLQQLTNLPPLSQDARRFIAAFLNVDQDINELAAELNEDFFDVVEKLCDPAIHIWITTINALKNNERRERALRSLDAALTQDPNPNNVRRAATRILRHFESIRPHYARSPRAIEVDRSEPTSMRATRDVELTNVPQSTTRQVVQRTAPPTPDLSESSSEGPGRTLVPPTCSQPRADFPTTLLYFADNQLFSRHDGTTVQFHQSTSVKDAPIARYLSVSDDRPP